MKITREIVMDIITTASEIASKKKQKLITQYCQDLVVAMVTSTLTRIENSQLAASRVDNLNYRDRRELFSLLNKEEMKELSHYKV